MASVDPNFLRRIEEAAYERGHRDGCRQGAAGLDDIVKGLEDEVARLRAVGGLVTRRLGGPCPHGYYSNCPDCEPDRGPHDLELRGEG